jgi:Ca-activated chloride channel family protein
MENAMKPKRALPQFFIYFCVFVFSAWFFIQKETPAPSHGSFVEGTEIWTKNGPVPIEQITRGTKVYAYDIESKEWSYKPVIETIKYNYSGNMVTLKAGKVKIQATEDHPFFVVKDLNSDYRPHIKVYNSRGWVPAGYLEAGDILLLKDDSRLTVERVSSAHVNQTVYNLNVARDHTFTVHNAGVLVSDVIISVKEVAYSYSSRGGGGCFPAGTEVWTKYGFFPIEDIGEGIEVYSQDTNTGQWAYKRVVNTSIRDYSGDIVAINTGEDEIEATGNHPFWVISGPELKQRPPSGDVPYSERGLTARGRWVEARHLMIGDVLRGIDNKKLEVKNLIFSYTPITVYNLTVEDFNTYTVGYEGFLVHNKSKGEAEEPMAEKAEIALEPMAEEVLFVPAQEWNTEQYERIYEQPFLKVLDNPLSTFSIDVDTASYSNVRRFLQGGKLPVKDAVRVEEFINYFSYDYPEPSGDVPFSFNTEISRCPWQEEHLLLHIGLQGKKIPFEDLPPNNLVFLVDVSGSMNSPDKLPLLKEALSMVVEQMRNIDRIALVVYAGAAGLVLPPTQCDQKHVILSALDRLNAGGSTAGGAGITLAYATAKKYYDPIGNNRVILATDGDFNVGVSSDGALVRLIEEKREDGIYLTVLGFGTGNYKDSRMEKLADKGNGNYAYIDTVREAKKVLVSELGGTLFTIAKDVKIQVEFNPAIIESYRLIGYENRMLRKEDFADDRKDAGELGAGHTVTALYEINPTKEGAQTVSELRYQSSEIKDDAYSSNEMMMIKFRYKNPGEHTSRLIELPVDFDPVPLSETSNNFRFSAAVAAFALILKDSDYKSSADCDMVLKLAEQSMGADPNWYRKDFLGMVKIARWLGLR